MYYPIELREQIVSEKLSGKSLLKISEERSLSYSTVKRIWQRYESGGESELRPNYGNCGLKSPKFYRIYRMSLCLKRRHLSWGAPLILTILEQRYPQEPVPQSRTLQKWFRSQGLNEPPILREKVKIPSVKEVHDCWQIDAKEKLQLQDKTKACYLTVVDVRSGAVLETAVFPLWQY